MNKSLIEFYDDTLLAAARRDRDMLVLEGAPDSVVRAADQMIQAARDKTNCAPCYIHVIREYANSRQQQDRYGK